MLSNAVIVKQHSLISMLLLSLGNLMFLNKRDMDAD